MAYDYPPGHVDTSPPPELSPEAEARWLEFEGLDALDARLSAIPGQEDVVAAVERLASEALVRAAYMK